MTLLLLSTAAFAGAQADPAALPARDAHEGVLVAADPYTDRTRARDRFGKKNPYEAGILAVEVYFRNDNERALRIGLERIRLLLEPPGQSRQRLEPLAVEDVLDRIVDKSVPSPTVPRPPIPGRKRTASRSKDWKELEAVLRPLSLEMDLLPPGSTVRGFVFFDLQRRYDWLAHARLYVPELKFVDNQQALFYFEVELAKALPR